MIAILEDRLDSPCDEQVVVLALKTLKKAKLLENEGKKRFQTFMSRRELLGKMVAAGMTCVFLPVITSIVVPPTAAYAQGASCYSQSKSCSGSCPPNTNCVSVSAGGSCGCSGSLS